jgi:hypothetical protein
MAKEITNIFTRGTTLPYAHYNGNFYNNSSAPSGAYPISSIEYYQFHYYIALGKTLSWYENQRPYTYEEFTQLNATSNTLSDGTIFSASSEASSRQAYKAMDGVKSGTSTSNCWSCNALASGWWQVSFPYKLSITKLVHYNNYYSSNAGRSVGGRFYADEQMTNPIGPAISTPDTSWYATTIYNSSTPLVTSLIFFNKTGPGESGTGLYSGIGELEITGTKIIYEAEEK